MPYYRWKPYEDLMDMYGKLNRLFEEDHHREEQHYRLPPNCWIPATDIYETKDGYVFKVELPGMTKENITVELEGDNLNVGGERKEETEIQKEAYHRMERICGCFSRTFELPKNADGMKMTAEMKNGILELRIPKKEKAESQSIPIAIK